MNNVDKENTERIVEIYEKFLGYDEESTKFAIEQLRNPKIDKEYSQFLGEDLRRRWPLDVNPEEEDKAYSMFSSLFHVLTCGACIDKYRKNGYSIVNLEEFNTNLKVYKKNTVKLKNYMVDFYSKEKKVFLDELDRATGTEALKLLSKKYKETWKELLKKIKGQTVTNEEIEEYIVKAFEVLGTQKKTKKTDLELVLSCNFADTFLGSTSESWSSCFDLEKGGYWYGVPGLIGDLNRAFLYTTRGEKKEFLGIKVDKVINRTWILLDNKNKKNIVRFYPNSSNGLGPDVIKRITGDNSYCNADDNKGTPAKGKIFPMFFSKGIYSSTSNDACRLEGKGDGIYMKIGEGGGTQYFDKKFEKISGYGDFDLNVEYLPEIMKKKGKASDIFAIKMCECCGAIKNIEKVNIAGKNVYLCSNCKKKEYEVCGHCGTYYKKGTEEFIKEDGKNYCKHCVEKVFEKCKLCGKLFKKSSKIIIPGVGESCPDCFNKKYDRCDACGNITKKGEVEYVVIDGRKLCVPCHENRYRKCEICGKEMPSEYFRKIDDVYVCKNCKDGDDIYKCRECKTEHLMKNILIIHDKTDGKRKKRCITCAPKLYPKHEKCRLCGELWEKERLHMDKTCPKCNGEDY